MGDFGRAALHPLKHYADFRGRSPRSQVVAFYILLILVAMVGEQVFGLFNIAGEIAGFMFSDLLMAAALCPLAALAVRRLHDHGKSGWWALLGLPYAFASIEEFCRTIFENWPAVMDLPDLARVPLSLGSLVLVVLLLWKDDEGTNRYGPNPRYADPDVPSDSATGIAR